MIAGLQRVEAPANLPVTLALAKTHVKVDSSAEDELIKAYLEASVGYVDGPRGYLGRALIAQTWDMFLDELPAGGFEIPLPPLLAVEGLYVRDAAGAETPVPEDGYVVDRSREPARVRIAAGRSWPTVGAKTNGVRLRFECGYQDRTVSPWEDTVPSAIKVAILMHLGDMYRNRETQVVGTIANPLPFAARELLDPYDVKLRMA